MDIVESDEFSEWFERLRDPIGKAAIIRRLDRIASGLLGDFKQVGGSIVELRIDVGPGYRIYLTQVGRVTVVLLCGGDKSSQARDIAAAKRLATQWKDRLA